LVNAKLAKVAAGAFAAKTIFRVEDISKDVKTER
jgi:hypothetical protein